MYSVQQFSTFMRYILVIQNTVYPMNTFKLILTQTDQIMIDSINASILLFDWEFFSNELEYE